MERQGFTLIELLVVLAILTVLLGFAIPGMGALTDRTNIAVTARNLGHTLQWARSQAVSRNMPVGVCPRSPEVLVECGSDYGKGWLVFEDQNGDRKWGGGDTLLKVHDVQTFPFRILNRAGSKEVAKTILFKPNGFSGQAMTMVVCPRARSLERSTGLVLNNLGRLSIRSGFKSCHF
jgi:type II secretion system protein H